MIEPRKKFVARVDRVVYREDEIAALRRPTCGGLAGVEEHGTWTRVSQEPGRPWLLQVRRIGVNRARTPWLVDGQPVCESELGLRTWYR